MTKTNMTKINPRALADYLMARISPLEIYGGPYGEDRLLQQIENSIKGFLKKRKTRSRKVKRK